MASYLLCGSVFLFLMFICATGTIIPPANNCANLTGAPYMNLTKLNGTWYVQKYTGPVNGNLQTRCDLFTINITENGTYGAINYTYILTKDNVSSVQLATLNSLPQIGKFEYQLQLQDSQVNMNTTVIVMQDNNAFIHVACSEDDDGSSSVVIATRNRDITADSLQSLDQLAAQNGASEYNLQQTDLKNCTFPGLGIGGETV